MIGWIVIVLLLMSNALAAQPTVKPSKPDIGLILCWRDEAESQLARDKELLEAAGRAFSLLGSAKTIGVRSEPCKKETPDASCFGLPGGMICRAMVIERMFRAASWLTFKYSTAGFPGYEKFRRSNPQGILQAFQYADGSRKEPEIDGFRNKLRGSKSTSQAAVSGLVDYSLATLIGHEIAHSYENKGCPVSERSKIEETGLLTQLIKNEQAGVLFARHSASPDEISADRCATRFLHALGGRITSRIADKTLSEFVRRAAADMVTFQTSLGWRRYEELPAGKYGVFSQDLYLYSPYRAILFAVEIHGMNQKPAICGYAAELLVQAIQTTYKKYEGGGEVSDDILALFSKGVEPAWNGAPWTPDSFSCDS